MAAPVRAAALCSRRRPRPRARMASAHWGLAAGAWSAGHSRPGARLVCPPPCARPKQPELLGTRDAHTAMPSASQRPGRAAPVLHGPRARTLLLRATPGRGARRASSPLLLRPWAQPGLPFGRGVSTTLLHAAWARPRDPGRGGPACERRLPPQPRTQDPAWARHSRSATPPPRLIRCCWHPGTRPSPLALQGHLPEANPGHCKPQRTAPNPLVAAR